MKPFSLSWIYKMFLIINQMMTNFFSLAIQEKNQPIDLMCLVKQHQKEKQYPQFRRHHWAYLLLAHLPNHQPFGQGPNWISDGMVSQRYCSLYFAFLPKTSLKGNVLCGSSSDSFGREQLLLLNGVWPTCQTEVWTTLASSFVLHWAAPPPQQHTKERTNPQTQP